MKQLTNCFVIVLVLRTLWFFVDRCMIFGQVKKSADKSIWHGHLSGRQVDMFPYFYPWLYTSCYLASQTITLPSQHRWDQIHFSKYNPIAKYKYEYTYATIFRVSNKNSLSNTNTKTFLSGTCAVIMLLTVTHILFANILCPPRHLGLKKNARSIWKLATSEKPRLWKVTNISNVQLVDFNVETLLAQK